MTGGPEVSVILPVRNGGAFLGQAVASILEQSLASLELIVVDDHSSDGAISRLQSRDSRLKVLINPGSGVSEAFNFGLAHAQGRYIARMDADDIALPQRLELQVRYLANNPDIGIAGGQVEFFPSAAVGKGNRLYQAWLNRLCDPGDIRRALFIESPVPNPTAMFRRQVMDKLGGYRDPDWPEDYDLFLRADQVGIAMGKPQGTVLRWREHAGRLTRRSKRYAPARFQAAKAHYLARSLEQEPVLIWGAGSGGALLHDLLAGAGVRVEGFIDVHPRRAGGHKRGKPVFGIEHSTRSDIRILVAVGTRGARSEIRQYMHAAGRTEGDDYLFCL